MDVLERFPLLDTPQQEVLDKTRESLTAIEFREVDLSFNSFLGITRDWLGNNLAINRVARQSAKAVPKTPRTADEYAPRLACVAFESASIEFQCNCIRQILAKYAGYMEASGDSAQVEESFSVVKRFIEFQATFVADHMLYATEHALGVDGYGIFAQSVFNDAKEVYVAHPKLQVPREVTTEQGGRIDELVDRRRRHVVEPNSKRKRRGRVGTIASEAVEVFRLKREMGVSIKNPPGAAALSLEQLRTVTRVEDLLELDKEEKVFVDRTARKIGMYIERAANFSNELAANPNTRFIVFSINKLDRVDPSASLVQFERDVSRTARKIKKGETKTSRKDNN